MLESAQEETNQERYDMTKNIAAIKSKFLTFFLASNLCAGLSGIHVEPVNEERATRCLQRISLLSAVREEVEKPHSQSIIFVKLF